MKGAAQISCKLSAHHSRTHSIEREIEESEQVVRFAQACFHCHLAAQRRSEKKKGSKHILPTPVYFHACPPTSLLATTPNVLGLGYLSLSLEGLGETAHVVLKGTPGAEELDVGTVDADLARLALGDVLLTTEGG